MLEPIKPRAFIACRLDESSTNIGRRKLVIADDHFEISHKCATEAFKTLAYLYISNPLKHS